MPAFCCILNCGSRGKRDPVKFFRIPVGRNFRHRQDINQLTAKRRQMWIQAIKRMGFTEQKLKNALVCSKHFVSGKPAELEDFSDMDWVPTVDMGYETLIIKSEPIIRVNDYKYCENQMAKEIKEISSNKIFDGYQKVFSHESKELGCSMKFGVFLPPSLDNETYPVIYWLSGLTCSENNFIEKSGAQRYAAQHGVIIVNPDTSPRGVNIPGASDSWDFGEGAGFYVDATQKPWKENYRMYSYVTKELIEVIEANFPVTEGARSIMGHSMGGHGALISALKNPTLYKSVSAFAPICNPSVVPWGIKAFSGYLGPKESSNWEEWDATELVKKYNGPPLELFIDQGLEDNFLPNQLSPDNLIDACRIGKVPLIAKKREGYNHSYFFIASFIEEHIKYHAQHLGL